MHDLVAADGEHGEQGTLQRRPQPQLAGADIRPQRPEQPYRQLLLRVAHHRGPPTVPRAADPERQPQRHPPRRLFDIQTLSRARSQNARDMDFWKVGRVTVGIGLRNWRQRRSGRRALRKGGVLASAGALAFVGLAAAPAAQAAVAPLNSSVYYIGDDGALWGYSRAADGTFSNAAQIGPDNLARPGSRLAAVRRQGDDPAVFFVGNDGAVWENCPRAPQPVPVTSTGYAPPGAAITASDDAGFLTVVVSSIAPLPGAAPAATTQVKKRPLEISNPCTPPTRMMVNTSAMSYTGGDMASTGRASSRGGAFYVDSSGALRAQWRSRATSGVISVQLTAANTATPGGGVAATTDDSGVLTLFFTGHDGKIYVTHPVPGGGLADTPRPNTTGPADVPDGAHLAAASSQGRGIEVGYAANDGTFTVASLSAGGAWLSTEQVGDTGVISPGASAGVTANSDGWDWYCGNVPRFPVHIRIPGPWPHWDTAGLPNVLEGSFFSAA